MKQGFPFPLLILNCTVMLLILFSGCAAPKPSTKPVPKAAIIDQLYTLLPNEAFINEVTQQLGSYGFGVEVYQGDEVTVKFYRKLPSYGYKLILFRVHSGILIKEGKFAQGTWLFTSEPHSLIKYTDERLTDKILKARTAKHQPWVFAIGSDFITSSMEGQFDGTVIIMMGCHSLSIDDLAKAFIKKGSSAYVGWNENLDLDYVDNATIRLVEDLCLNDTTIKQAADKVMSDMGAGPLYGARLKYYPFESASLTLRQIVN